MPGSRARDLGWIVGRLQPGVHNAITDVAGVLVGHTTLNSGQGRLIPGKGPVRLPHAPQVLVAELATVIDEAAVMQGLFAAAADCVEEAVLNALCAAETTTGRDDHTAYALPVEAVSGLLRHYGRLAVE